MRTTWIRFIPLRLTIATTVVLLAACGDGAMTGAAPRPDVPASHDAAVGKASMVGSRMAANEVGVDAAAPPAAFSAQPAEFSAQNVAGALPTSAAQTDVTAANNMVIRNGNASILVDSLQPAIARITLMAARLGGFVANTQIQSGNEQVPSATLELKLPSSRFEQAASELAPLGKVEFVNTTAQDVGEEFVDVTARMTNARHLEERLVELLARRTGKLEEVLSVERELARVRGEIERYEGRLRFLRARVAMSTLSITVHEKAPIVSSNPGENVLGTAAKEAWRNFVNFLAALIASLGWLIPLGVLALVATLVGRRVLRGRPPAVTTIAPKEA